MEECKFWNNTNKGRCFDCMECGEENDLGDYDEHLHICFTHCLVLCDECIDNHKYAHKTQEEIQEEEKISKKDKFKEELKDDILQHEKIIEKLKKTLNKDQNGSKSK